VTIFGLREAFGIPTAPKWRRFMASMVLGAGDGDEISRVDLDKVIVASTVTVPANEMRAVLVRLGVVQQTKVGLTINHACAGRVLNALEILDGEGNDDSNRWRWVATLPKGIDRTSVPADIAVTKACILSLVEGARTELWLATPYMDYKAIDFLEDPLVSALGRGVRVKVLTATCNAGFIEALVGKVEVLGSVDNLSIWEASTLSSFLGTHAKAVISDCRHGYLGSANLTSYGLDRHFELGVQVAGPRVPELAQILAEIAKHGNLRFGRSESDRLY
jgi:phosphatidylserine/phosphatidylglycerophosphate/cardiolipin synthase-like enzyme